MDETDHGLTPRIANLKVNRKVNEINDLPTPPPRQCWVCVPPVIALKTRGPRLGVGSTHPRKPHQTRFVVCDLEPVSNEIKYLRAESVELKRPVKAANGRQYGRKIAGKALLVSLCGFLTVDSRCGMGYADLP